MEIEGVVSDEVMNLLRDSMNKEVDVRTLPYDSVRRTRERLLEDQANGFDYNRFDLETVLGKPNTGITMPQIEREIREYFMKSVGDLQERAKFLKNTEEARIKERREMYKRAGKYLSSD